MGKGWNVTFENKTNSKISVGSTLHNCWYPNELGDNFELQPGAKTTKYTEIKSSGTCPTQKSYLDLQLVLWAKQQQISIELKGTNGDLNDGFKQLVDGDGFEIGIKGDPKLLDFKATKPDDKIHVDFTFT